MADADVQQALAALAQLGAAAGGSRAAVAAVGQSMARLRIEMQRGTGTVQSNAAALNKLTSDFDNLDEAARRSTAGQNMLAEQTRMASQIMQQAAGSLSAGVLKGGLVEAIDYVSKQLFTSIASYQEGASGVQTAFASQNAAMESQIRILDRLSSGAGTAAETLALIPSWYGKGAAALAGLTSAAAAFGKGFNEKQLQLMQAFQKEVATGVVSFDVMNKSGALFSRGIMGAKDAAGALQLTLPELSKTVSENRKDLADFGNSVIGGVKKLTKVGTAFTELAAQGKDYRKELEYAGYSQQEQVDGMIKYMEMLNTSGQLRSMSDKQIVMQGTEYLKNLKAISAFTGEDAKQAQKRAQQASEQLAVQAKLAKQGPGAFERFTSAVSNMGPEITKGLQQMTAFDGTIVDKNLNQLLAVSPTRKKLLEETYADMQNSALGAEEVNKRYQQRVAEYGDALKKEALAAGETYGAVNVATGQMGEVTGMLEKQAELGRKGEAAKEKEIAMIGDTTAQMSRLITDGLDPFRKSIIEAERVNRETLPKFMNQMLANTTLYMQKMGGDKGPAEEIRKQREGQVADMRKMIGDLAARTPAAKDTKIGKMVEDAMVGSVNLLVSGLTRLGPAIDTVADKFEKLGGVFARIPGFSSRDLGTLGMTGSLFEKEDFFGKVAAGETVLTPMQLENLVKGVGISSAQDTAGKSAEGITASLEKLAKSVTPTQINVAPVPQTDNLQNINTQVKDSFAQSMAAFQQQKLQTETARPVVDETESNKLAETIQEAFSGQNGFNQMLSNLKGQLETDNGKQIAVLQEQVTKLEDLLSAMQDNVDYSKRIADNIA